MFLRTVSVSMGVSITISLLQAMMLYQVVITILLLHCLRVIILYSLLVFILFVYFICHSYLKDILKEFVLFFHFGGIKILLFTSLYHVSMSFPVLDIAGTIIACGPLNGCSLMATLYTCPVNDKFCMLNADSSNFCGNFLCMLCEKFTNEHLQLMSHTTRSLLH